MENGNTGPALTGQGYWVLSREGAFSEQFEALTGACGDTLEDLPGCTSATAQPQRSKGRSKAVRSSASQAAFLFRSRTPRRRANGKCNTAGGFPLLLLLP